jgi:excisionase family DNA binding protein
MKELHTGETEYLTLKEAAAELRVSVPTVWRWVKSGKLAAYRVGGRAIRLRRGDVERMVERHPAALALDALGGRYIVLGDPNVAMEDVIAELDRFRAEQRAKYGTLPSSVPDIRDARENWHREI